METFTRIYATNAWGKGSGAGSVPAHCYEWITFLRWFIRQEGLRSVADLGCGDWQFSPYIYHDLHVHYVGYDIVSSVVEENQRKWSSEWCRFEQLDFSTHVENLAAAELYILKDVLQHWSSERIEEFLHELLAKPGLRFVLVCNCASPVDWPVDNIVDGGWRPLFASRPPLLQFAPEVLMRYPSMPNEKEVCLIRPQQQVRDAAGVACALPPATDRTGSGNFCSVGTQRRCWQERHGNSNPFYGHLRFIPVVKHRLSLPSG